MSKPSQLAIAQDQNIDQLRANFGAQNRVQVVNFLTKSSADRIYQSLRDQQDWNLAWNKNGSHTDMNYEGVSRWTESQKKQLDEIIHKQAEHKFQYRYAAVPIHDIYHQNLLPGHFFNQLYEFINNPQTIQFVRDITGLDSIAFADAQATRYSKGHFLTEHDDFVEGKNRLVAYVINLTPKWKKDWGGALIFPDEDHKAEAWFPRFNVLNLLAVPQKHAVTVVSPFAPVHRYAITGWFRSE